MSKREVAELACRIVALYYLVVNLHSFCSLPIMLGTRVCPEPEATADRRPIRIAAAPPATR